MKSSFKVYKLHKSAPKIYKTILLPTRKIVCYEGSLMQPIVEERYSSEPYWKIPQ